jgi:hypothetical protein
VLIVSGITINFDFFGLLLANQETGFKLPEKAGLKRVSITAASLAHADSVASWRR